MQEASFDNTLRKHFYTADIVHGLMNCVITKENIEQKYKNLSFQFLQRLIDNKKARGYIPGETLQQEQQKARIMQLGIIPLCLCILKSNINPELVKTVKTHLYGNYSTDELEWILSLMRKSTNTEEITQPAENSIKYFEDCIFTRII